MPSVETRIWMALRQRVAAAAGQLPVAWPGGLDEATGEVFRPPFGGNPPVPQPYLSVGSVSGPPRRVLIERGPTDRSGSVTLVFVAPMGNPAEWYIQKATQIMEHFPLDDGLRFQGVCVKIGNGLSVPHVTDSYPDNGYLRTPLIIPWRCAA